MPAFQRSTTTHIFKHRRGAAGWCRAVTGKRYPRSLIKPDRENFSPHIGLAWQASRDTTVRAAYGINYGVGEYGGLIQYLAYQPPFADVQANANVPHFISPFRLEAGFGNNVDIGNLAISRNYGLPYIGSGIWMCNSRCRSTSCWMPVTPAQKGRGSTL